MLEILNFLGKVIIPASGSICKRENKNSIHLYCFALCLPRRRPVAAFYSDRV
nr:MAG TPA: Hepatitis E virus ORF-2 (Putative capsid protein) [Caudoviricetes sp.]